MLDKVINNEVYVKLNDMAENLNSYYNRILADYGEYCDLAHYLSGQYVQTKKIIFELFGE